MHEDSVLIGPRVTRTGPASLYPMIAAQSQLRPDAIAISYGARLISYAQLGRQSALIRDALLAAGSTPGQLVPILTRGGPGMIAAMLGVWAAGAAFAPLAMDGPEARRDMALSRIGVGIAVVDTIEDAPDGWACISIAQTLDAELDRTPATVDSTHICPGDSLAYGFFTSGSTGIPKCCLNIHSGLVNRAATMSRRFNLRPGEAVLQNSSHVFDSSLWQIFWPLSVGAEVAIPERYSILDFEATLNTIAARRVVMTDFVPTILEQLITTLRNSAPLLSKLASLRYILVGGEQLNAHLLRDLLQLLPAVQIVNTYGPTEASIGMVFHAFTGKEAAVPLGLPIDNTALAVVDENLRPVPRGRIGEIVIGGACMGIGYLGDPERTEAVFQRGTGLPLGSDVVYRTGDLGRIEADGLLYFDGRADDQIKIAGVRIELGEIEHHLYDYPNVLKAKVIPVKNDGQTWLAGFYSASAPIAQQDLRAHLERKLGKSSVPSMLRQLASFPLTVSGKIDGKTLIATHCTFEAGSPDASASANSLPEMLIQAVQRALPGHQPKLDDDLILAGLDSLGALKLLLEAERITGKNIPLPAFLTRPTITTLLSNENDSAHPADVRDDGADHDEAALIESDIRRLGQLSDPASNASPASPAATRRAAPEDGTIVLTGATGYVGRALLSALLRDGATSIVCPVRAADDQAATARLVELIPGLPANRVRVLALDLCADDAIRRLPSAPRIVVHAAADVNFSKTYRQLRETNVHSTAALCAYALEHGARFHYVSSVVAFAGQDAGPLSQRSSADIRHALSRLGNGYSRTKWASEQIIAAFQDRGLEAEAYRLGEMMPDALYPIANPLATFTILCRVARLTGVVPELAEVSNCTPTGLAAQWIAHRCLADRDVNTNANVDTKRLALGTLLAHPTEVPVDAMFHAVLGKMPCVSLSKFRDIVGRRYGETQHPDLARCLMIFSSVNRPEDEKYLFERSAVSRPSTQPAPTHRDHHEAAPAWSTMTSKDLDDMFDVFRQSVLSH